jgi:hypothetical protein
MCKKNTFVFCIVFSGIVSSANAQTIPSRLVSIANYNYDTAGHYYTLYDTTSYNYSGANGGDLNHPLKFSNEYYYNFNGHQKPVNTFWYQQTFNSSDNIDTLLEQSFDTLSNSWTNAVQTFYNYDSNNNDTLQFSKVWFVVQWDSASLNRLQYDINNNLTSITYYSWDDTNWVYVAQYLYTYDINNNLTQQIYQTWDETTSTWVIFDDLLFQYDSNNNDTAYTYREWNYNTSQWVNANKYVNTYGSDHNMLTSYLQSWNTTSWGSPIARYLFYDDANDNDTSMVSQYYYNGTGWVNNYQIKLTYNTFNQLTSTVNYAWNDSAWIPTYQSVFQSIFPPTNYPKSLYYYSSNSGIEQLPGNVNHLSIYPNPTSGEVNIVSTKNIDELKVFNLLGQLVYESPSGDLGLTQFTFELKDEGMYFVTVTAGNEITAGKIIVSK